MSTVEMILTICGGVGMAMLGLIGYLGDLSVKQIFSRLDDHGKKLDEMNNNGFVKRAECLREMAETKSDIHVIHQRVDAALAKGE